MGERGAVCFQNTPLSSIAQAVYSELLQFERTVQESGTPKIRYFGAGLSFEKKYMFDQGARPVIYEETSCAKKFLDKNEWWRIVKLDLSDADNLIDWTHEREWRVPDSFKFSLDKATLIFETSEQFNTFRDLASQNGNNHILSEIAGVVVLDKGVF